MLTPKTEDCDVLGHDWQEIEMVVPETRPYWRLDEDETDWRMRPMDVIRVTRCRRCGRFYRYGEER